MANAAGEALGLGTTFALGAWIAPRMTAEPTLTVVMTGVVAAVLFGTVLEGVLVGAFQARVLRDALPAFRQRPWILATSLGAGVAWLLGMIPSSIMALRDVPGADDATVATSTAEPGAMVQLLLAALLGLVLGPVLAGAQLFVLRHYADGAGRWIPANALAWAVGMPAIFTGMDLLPWDSGGATLIVGLFAVSGAAGAIVGAVHGRALLRMMRR